MKKRNHDALRRYWLRVGKPQLFFKHGDDPWLAVQGEPSFNPAFEYSFGHEGDATFTLFKSMLDGYRHTAPARPDTESYDYKRGYKQALDDVKAETERLQTAKRCQLKSSM